MGCLSLNLQPLPQAKVTVQPAPQARLSLKGYPDGVPHPTAVVNITPQQPAKLVISPIPRASLALAPQQQARLRIGEVCSVSEGEIYVLAASDGPLRTCDGGYILLNPEEEQDD